MNHPVVVAFFGRQSFERLESMLQFFSKILHQQDWNDFLFILCTPGDKTVNSLSNELPPYIRSRCHQGSGHSDTLIFRETLDLILNMYFDRDLLHLHLICDDFLDPLFPADAPARLTDILKCEFRLNVQAYYYFLLHINYFLPHADSLQVIDRQRCLAQSISRDPGAFPYLLSTTMDNHSLSKPETLSRAMMCEILTISQDKRLLLPGTVSSLGYTSLNANDEELVTLRRNELLKSLNAGCTSAFSNKEAWAALLPGIAPLSNSPSPASECPNVLEWLKRQIDQDIKAPTGSVLSNFRTLTDVAHQTSTDDLFFHAKRFYELNTPISSPEDLPAADSCEIRRAKAHMDALIEQLSRRLNLGNFPMDIFDTLLLPCLTSLCKSAPKDCSPQYPAASLLDKTLGREQYMTACSEKALEAAHESTVNRLVPQYARAFGQMFSALKDRLAHAASIADLLQQQMPTSYIAHHLIGKYPNYHNNILNTLGTLQPPPFQNIRLYDAGFSPSEQAIHEAIDRADRLLLKGMDPDFQKGFINAIRAQFPTPADRDAFLGKYLRNDRVFLPDDLALHAPSVSTFFCDVQLQGTGWANNNPDQTFFVQNDNVERLDYFPLNNNARYRTLDDFLNPQNDPQYFPYFFGQGAGISFPSAPTSPIEPEAAPHDDPDDPPPVHAVVGDFSPHFEIHPNGSRCFLTWAWHDRPHYQITVNNREEKISHNQYTPHGFDIGPLLSPGMNRISLMLLGQPQPLATLEYYRTKGTIRYQKFQSGAQTCSLVIQNTPNLPDALSKWAVVDRSQASPIYYPLSLASFPSSRVKSVRYNHLALGSGNWELVVAPDKRFCCAYPPVASASVI